MSGRERAAGAARPIWWVALALVAAILVVYAPVGGHQFLNYDDDEYVTGNPAVRAGLTLDGVTWALTSVHSATWHPLTSVSHMLDVELFGLDAGAHLSVNVALHALASVLLLGALTAMTGARWPSAVVAALFALHPLHVESVAWVSERKDVLAGVCWMVALWAYARYARRPGWGPYAVLVTAFGLGLLAKPMVVTLPFVLLLLDVWPLGRLRLAARAGRAALPALVREKLPLFVMAAAASVVTLMAQRSAGALATLDAVPLGARVANALVAYLGYLRKLVWPLDLAPFYPFRADLPDTQVVAAALVLAALSALALASARRRPYLLVGWLWYVGTLVPVIGLVRQGEQAMADRFTYLPLVGVFIVIAFAGAEWSRPRRRPGIAAGALLVLATCAILSARQVRHWETSETLFRHTLAVTTDNYLAHTNLGAALSDTGRDDEAAAHFTAALRLKPDYAKAQLNYGRALAARGETEAAAAHYAEALKIDPRSAIAEYNWGLLLAEQGELDAAIARYRRALALDPRYANAHNNLGWALAAAGRLDEAVAEYRAALDLAPDLVAAHNNLAVALERLGEEDEALVHYRTAARLAPSNAEARYNLATVLLGRGQAADAVEHFRAVVRLAPDLAEGHHGLAVALAAGGDFAAAAAAAEQALAAARRARQPGLAAEIAERLAAYRAAARSSAR